MRAPRASGTSGFTLVELLIGASLSAAIMAAVLSSYIFLGRGLARTTNQQTLETQARRTLGYFAQEAKESTGLADAANLSSAHLAFAVPTANATQTIVYHFNSTDKALYRGRLWNSSEAYGAGEVVVYNGSGYRCIAAHTNQVPPNSAYWAGATPLLSNLITFAFRYYDSRGIECTSFTDYLPSIKKVALTFETQVGTATAGTQTKPYKVASGRFVMRNKPFLP